MCGNNSALHNDFDFALLIRLHSVNSCAVYLTLFLGTEYIVNLNEYIDLTEKKQRAPAPQNNTKTSED